MAKAFPQERSLVAKVAGEANEKQRDFLKLGEPKNLQRGTGRNITQVNGGRGKKGEHLLLSLSNCARSKELQMRLKVHRQEPGIHTSATPSPYPNVIRAVLPDYSQRARLLSLLNRITGS